MTPAANAPPVTGILILLCVVSRVIAVPVYLRELGWAHFDPSLDVYFNRTSKGILFLAGFSGAGIVLWNVFRAYFRRRRVAATLDMEQICVPAVTPGRPASQAARQ